MLPASAWDGEVSGPDQVTRFAPLESFALRVPWPGGVRVAVAVGGAVVLVGVAVPGAVVFVGVAVAGALVFVGVAVAVVVAGTVPVAVADGVFVRVGVAVGGTGVLVFVGVAVAGAVVGVFVGVLVAPPPLAP